MSDWESYGPPALTIGPLEIWVHGREFPESDDEWDGNWLRVSARCSVHGAIVRASGAFLDTVSFVRYANELRALQKTLTGEAGLRRMTRVEEPRTGLPGFTRSTCPVKSCHTQALFTPSLLHGEGFNQYPWYPSRTLIAAPRFDTFTSTLCHPADGTPVGEYATM